MEDFGMNPHSGMALSGQVSSMGSQWDEVGALDSSMNLTAALGEIKATTGKGAYTSGAENLSALDTKTELNPSQVTAPRFVATSDLSSETTTGEMDSLTGLAENTPLVAPATTTADFNGDGQTDLLWRNSVTGRNVAWLMRGTTRSSVVSLPTVSDRNWRIEGTGDFNGDNRTDLIWRNFGTGTNAVWLMRGTTLASTVSLPTVSDLNWAIEGTGDFNSDGQTDLAWRNYQTGNNSAWLMRGTRLVSSAPLPALADTDWQLEATGDFNGDNQTDLVWRDSDTNRSAIWLLNGTRFTSSARLLPTIPNPDWQIRVSGDFNGDNQADIGWRNIVTDQVAIWLMDGTRLASSVSLPVFPGSWELVGPR